MGGRFGRRERAPGDNRPVGRSIRERALVLAFAVLVALPACGGSSASESSAADDPETEFIAPEEACSADADCVITDEPVICCACCGCAVPYAMNAAALEQKRAECATTDCEPIQEELGCAVEECVGCPLEEGPFEAVCRSGRCVREP